MVIYSYIFIGYIYFYEKYNLFFITVYKQIVMIFMIVHFNNSLYSFN